LAGEPFGTFHVEATRGTVKPFFAIFKKLFTRKKFFGGRARGRFGAPFPARGAGM
jgi:hypothetical protein